MPPQTLRPVVVLPFALWARIADEPKLALADAEADALAAALAAVLDKYIPAAGGNLPPEVALLMAAGMVVAPRVMLIKSKGDADNDGSDGTEQQQPASGKPAGEPPSSHGPGWPDPPPARTPSGQ